MTKNKITEIYTTKYLGDPENPQEGSPQPSRPRTFRHGTPATGHPKTFRQGPSRGMSRTAEMVDSRSPVPVRQTMMDISVELDT